MPLPRPPAVRSAGSQTVRLPISQAPSRRRPLACPPPPRPATSDLRGYLANVELPTISRHDRSHPYCLPPKGRRSHKNKLRIRVDTERCLDQIQQHKPKALDDATRRYHRDYVYGPEGPPFAGKHYGRREGEALVLPAKNMFTREETFENIPYPTDLEETCRWLQDRPFKTLQRAVHLAFPDTTRWWLDEAEPPTQPDDVANRRLWRTYLWRFHPDEYQPIWWRDVPGSKSGVETEPAPPESMVIVVQPPWILARQDMKNVSECTSVPSFPDDGISLESRLHSDQLVWAKLQDTCKRHDCRTFALTTYHGWLFGTFSEDWVSAKVSEVKDFDATRPTVMQTLVYWVASSMGLAGTDEWPPAVEAEPPVAGRQANVRNESAVSR